VVSPFTSGLGGFDEKQSGEHQGIFFDAIGVVIQPISLGVSCIDHEPGTVYKSISTVVFEEDAVLGQADDFNLFGCMRHYESSAFSLTREPGVRPVWGFMNALFP
jgi:hypothetical protein